MEKFDHQLDSFDHHHEVRKQVEMYFDQVLDAQSRHELLQKVNSDPSFFQIFENEKHVRNHLKKYIYRPSNSDQLLQAIKNQILKP